jgi:hypothetical protein
MDEIQEPRRRSRWWLVAILVTLIALVGAVVSLRESATTSHHQVSIAASPAATTIFLVGLEPSIGATLTDTGNAPATL